jgi:hypothetical protein
MVLGVLLDFERKPDLSTPGLRRRALASCSQPADANLVSTEVDVTSTSFTAVSSFLSSDDNK